MITFDENKPIANEEEAQQILAAQIAAVQLLGVWYNEKDRIYKESLYGLTFGERLRSLRKYHHLTQKYLAECAHVDERTIRRYEAAKEQPNIKISTLVLLANRLCVSVDLIMGLQRQSRKEGVNND
ncbi:MAG: helix-turn-helix transcriptional regulator [Candidatus Coproplasma sp.]